MTIQNSLSALLKSKQVNHITIRERLKIMNIKALVATATLLIAGFGVAQAAKPIPPHVGISAEAVKQSLKKFGFAAEQFKDKKGNPHFVLKDKSGNEKALAIFMDDCKAGRCADVTFYADFGPVAKLKAGTLNEWNHIASKLRSRAFRSGGVDNAKGEVGLSSTVSYLSDKDDHAFGMQLGLFLVEVRMFSATIAKL